MKNIFGIVVHGFARGDWGCHLSVDEETGLE